MSLKYCNADDADVILDKPGVYGVVLGDMDYARVVRIRLEAESGIPLHEVAEKAIFFVLRGSGELQVGKELRNMATGDLAFVEAGAERAWHNPGPEALEILVTRLV